MTKVANIGPVVLDNDPYMLDAVIDNGTVVQLRFIDHQHPPLVMEFQHPTVKMRIVLALLYPDVIQTAPWPDSGS
jgi:hypothetical protein